MDYCKRNRFVNIYGQSVRLKFLHAVDAYALPDDELSAGCEVYSSTAISPRSVSNAELVAERFGKVKGRSPNRYKFMDREILKDVLATIRCFLCSASPHPVIRRTSLTEPQWTMPTYREL